jgi:hypothetical protein
MFIYLLDKNSKHFLCNIAITLVKNDLDYYYILMNFARNFEKYYNHIYMNFKYYLINFYEEYWTNTDWNSNYYINYPYNIDSNPY